MYARPGVSQTDDIRRRPKCFYSSIQSFTAVEPPPDNLPTFLTTDVLRDPKK
ncbi:unnamed protein product, partial [Rotaria sp. Silwood1]